MSLKMKMFCLKVKQNARLLQLLHHTFIRNLLSFAKLFSCVDQKRYVLPSENKVGGTHGKLQCQRNGLWNIFADYCYCLPQYINRFVVLKTFFYLWYLVNCFLDYKITNILLLSLKRNRLTELFELTIEVYAILVG